jgi:hypothetical protein
MYSIYNIKWNLQISTQKSNTKNSYVSETEIPMELSWTCLHYLTLKIGVGGGGGLIFHLGKYDTIFFFFFFIWGGGT